MTTYRSPQPAPTTPGWYYGRTVRGGIAIRPLYVTAGAVWDVTVIAPAGAYVWYGPVADCKEG